MSASEAAGESSSSRARQDEDAGTDTPQRRWVALDSKAVIVADAQDEHAFLAMARRTNDVAFNLRDPPRPSYLVLHPRIAALELGAGLLAAQPSAYILAADPSGRLLFRVTKPEEEEHETMYVFNIHTRRTTTLPAVPYSDLDVEPQPRRSVGLIADPRPGYGGAYRVVQLLPRPPGSVALADKLLYYNTSELKWKVKQLQTTTRVRDRNLRGETGVLAHGGRLYWLALGYGIFVCDPFAWPSHLGFVWLPDGCLRLETEVSEANRAYVAQRRRVAPSEGHLRFVDVQGLSYDPDVAHQQEMDRSVRMWTLVEPEGEDPWWRFEYEVPFADVWALESYADFRLPHGEVPRVAFVDPDDHRIVYFLNLQGSKLFGLDVRDIGRPQVVSCTDCSVRDDREIMLQNSRPIIDAWEVLPPPPPSPGGRPRGQNYNEIFAQLMVRDTPMLVEQYKSMSRSG